MQGKSAWAVDTLNGTAQELKIAARARGTAIRNLLIKDYPVFVRVER